MKTIFALLVLLGLWVGTAEAITFWDDELESGNIGADYDLLVNTPNCGGQVSWSYDTTNKVSGNGSIKATFPGAQYHQLCGGFQDRTFPQTHDLWSRYYVRLSPGFAGDFVGTKLIRNDGTNSGYWWVMMWGGTDISVSVQGYPTNNDTTQLYPNAGSGTLPADGTWHCIETHILNNLVVDQPTGMIEAWKDGVKFLNYPNLALRRSGQFNATNIWQSNRMYRQDGAGTINYDRMAFGNTRIGCSGSPSSGDTTPPGTPTGLSVQ
jgi:hypothetical protein